MKGQWSKGVAERYQYKQQKGMDKPEIAVTLPTVDSYRYKDNVKEIEELMRDLSGFTTNLEDKVNMMLRGQETEFVNSYKQHIFKIERALLDYQDQINQYQKKIQHYQNEGMLSSLLKKIQFLQDNERKLLNSLQKKERSIHTLRGDIGTQEREILSLHSKIKDLLKQAPARQTIKPEEEPTFATEIHMHDKKTLKSSHYSIEYARSQSPHYQTLNNPEQNKEPSFEQSQLKRVNRQLGYLKKKHQELSSVNSKIIEKASSIEEFFVRVINDLKRKITGRKKFTECTFEDFKQEDKLELLVKVLSNEEVLQHLYRKIFSNNGRVEIEQAKWEGRDKKVEKELRELNRSERVVSRLPEINYRKV